uniref:Mitogen-activated protein kinase 4 n=1 Tax=Bangia atropurpurea TaxID=31347 RepID=A0A3G2FQ60_BANAT|nr:mitogen-activated protein kinase 4 [Bangia atropurpurea]
MASMLARILDGQYQLIRSLTPVNEQMRAPVLLAFDHRFCRYVAIKGAVDIFSSLQQAKRILRELKFAVRLSGHPNIVTLHNLLVPSSLESFTGIFMVFGLMRCDLSVRLAEGCAVVQEEARNVSLGHGTGLGSRVGKPVNSRLVKRWMYELLMGLAYMHESGVLHRDIKPSNLLLDDQDHLRICDLGLARADCRRSEDDMYLWTSHVVTRAYRAPELFLGRDVRETVSPRTSPRQSYVDPFPSPSPTSLIGPSPGTGVRMYPARSCYSPAIDMWSVGAVFAEALTGRVLFSRRSPLQEHLATLLAFTGTPTSPGWADGGGASSPSMKAFLTGLPVFPGVDKKSAFPGVSAEGAALLDALLSFDPRDRPTAAEALQFPYFASMHEEYHRYHPRPPPRVQLDPADWAFEMRPPSPQEGAELRREILDEIRNFRARENTGPWPHTSTSVAMTATAGHPQFGTPNPPTTLRQVPSAETVPAGRTHDGEAKAAGEGRRLATGGTLHYVWPEHVTPQGGRRGYPTSWAPADSAALVLPQSWEGDPASGGAGSDRPPDLPADHPSNLMAKQLLDLTLNDGDGDMEAPPVLPNTSSGGP